MKEQTPITADQQTIKDLWNAKTADEIATILKKHTNTKVLEALEMFIQNPMFHFVRKETIDDFMKYYKKTKQK